MTQPSRREFIASTAAMVAFAASAHAGQAGATPAKPPASAAPTPSALERRKFGATDMTVTVLGFGGAEIGYQKVDQEIVDRLLNAALDAGLNVIDTAECYAGSEEAIGKAVSKRRKDFHLFTKVVHMEQGDAGWTAGSIEKSIDRSLQRLQTDHLDLPTAGLEADGRGRIFVDDNYQTKVDHIYAVGDVIGFPALAATSMEQGRLAAYHAFGEPTHSITEIQPIGIYSIPEVSYVGATEVDLTKDSVPYEVGVSRYRELARGQIAGDSYGMLKLLVSTEDLRLLGVHIFGTNATEMVHIGQAVMGCGGTVEYLVDAVFNYPTFSEAYKVAALDVMNKLRALRQVKR